jgi:hypothetical protein
MSRDQTAGENHNIKVGGKSFDSVEQFKHLGRTLTSQNSIHEKIKCRLNLGNACYPSVQNLLSSRLHSKNTEIKVYRTIILPVFCMGVKLCLSQ